MDIADINKNLSIELAISRGRTKEALTLLREREGVKGRLYEMLCNLADPASPKRMGRPVETDTPEYKSYQRLMMFEYYFLRAYYKAQGKWKPPGEIARGHVIKNHTRNITFFEKAQKRYGNMYKRDVEYCLELMDEQGIDFPEWIKSYPDI